ncbi:formyltransferase family protein [Hoeflea sp.]|uniref:formyltransferase family protein n=1 Tax=Hoeflea sp. TaxID=1940281 RepID=UPI003B02E25B
MSLQNSFRALVVVENSIVSSAFLNSWLLCGNTISALWTRNQKLLASSTTQKLVSIASSVPTLDNLVKKYKIPVIRNEPLKEMQKSDDLQAQLQADTLITLMTHQIVPEWIIDQFGNRAVNVHPALLPHYKGPQPSLSLLVDGQAERYGGITVHRLDYGIDTGAIIAQRKIPAVAGQDFNVWTYRIALAAADLARNELQAYLKGQLDAVPQVPGSGNYRKVVHREFYVDENKTLDEVRHLLALPAGTTIRAAITAPPGKRDLFPVLGKVTVISAPTGAKPRLTPVSIEMDIRDHRIRVLRKRKIASLLTNPAIAVAKYRLGNFGRGTPQA